MTFWISGTFAILIAGLSLHLSQSAAFERPTQSAIGILLSAALCLFLLRIFVPHFFSSNHVEYHANNQLQLSTLPRSSATHPLPSIVATRRRFITFVLAISFRVYITRTLLIHRQCTSSTIEGFLPLLLAAHEYWIQQPRKAAHDTSSADGALASLSRIRPSRQIRIVLSVAVFSGAYFSIASFAPSPRSTNICPISTLDGLTIPVMQFLGLLLDTFILVNISSLFHTSEDTGAGRKNSSSVFVGFLLLASAVIVISVSLIVFFTHPSQWGWVLSVDKAYAGSLALWSFLLSIVLPCALRIIATHGPLHLSMCMYIPIAYANVIELAQSTHEAGLFLDGNSSIINRLVALTVSAIFYLQASQSTKNQGPSPKPRFYGRAPFVTIFCAAFLVWSWSFLHYPANEGTRMHPLDGLLSAASTQHDAWLQQASASKTLDECTAEYRRRYKRPPPPGFDAWYRYATERSSVIIDDFDNLMDDLQLFWAIRPAEIRKRTHLAFGDWNEVAKLSVRSGKAEIGPEVKPTHRWMLDGVIAMMSNYIDQIPDMDLAFNINDEPRIAIPYDDLRGLLKASAIGPHTAKDTVLNEFSKDRAASWNFLDSSDPETPNGPFTDQSFLPSFHTYGSISCPRSSRARRSYLWDTRALCITCFAPHSTGIFLSNWTLSASPCHQPDLAHLHGFYLSPAAFKPCHSLYPIFSQSKANGYADIRYPSPWNYMDKAVYAPSPNASDLHYDPPFSEKSDILFWRGATSEGLSRFGEWQGMARQRLVHLANNDTSSTLHPIFLPNIHPRKQNQEEEEGEASYSLHTIPSSLLPALGLGPTITDIHLVSKIDRCWDADCPVQAREFGLSEPTDFQSHWRHKYLVDLDGAGFSGRFIPFLQSRSLPFKVAGVFREWWDGRVTAWKHFVPLDVRLMGWWSTVAYFMGVRELDARGVRVGAMRGRRVEGERIANEGREWVGKVIRKEDMEVYFYRLLLEWGRLTDDRREELGFVG